MGSGRVGVCTFQPWRGGLPLRLSTMPPSAARYPRLLIRLLPIQRFESCDTPFESLAFSFSLRIYIYIYLLQCSSNSHARRFRTRLRTRVGAGSTWKEEERGGERGKGVGARDNEAATAQLTPNLESRSFLRRGYIVNDSVVSHVFFPPLVLSSRDKTRRASLEGGSRAIVISPTVPPQRDSLSPRRDRPFLESVCNDVV